MAKYTNLMFLHMSMQFSDTPEQQRHDAEKVFAMGADIVTGTEAGSKTLRRILRSVAKKYGYTFHVKGDCWVSVHKSLIASRWFAKGYVPVLKPSEGSGKHSNRGVTWVRFRASDGIGVIAVGVGHYLTKGRPGANFAYRVNLRLNALYARAVGRWAKRKGKGAALAFYAGDQNIVDKFNDTFFGQPLTTSWDELKKWQNTGHGNIDVVASYDRDARVEWRYVRTYNDKALFLHTDHFLVKSVAKVKMLDS